MTEKKVFNSDPYLTELETTVVSSKSDERGIWYSFQETLFYPQGGGQSSDKGWVNSKDILDVQSIKGEIWHLVNDSLPEEVSIQLDWYHRYTNMQQHTGQHILSACFKEFHNLDTLSVHLGADITMIELDTAIIEDDILKNTEEKANQMIRDNLPVQAIIVDRNNLGKHKLRRTIKTGDEQVRLVKIGDIDCVGCGGTHVRSTGEVGLIKILGSEKIRGHSRIKIKIGATAYQYFRELHHTLHQVSTKLTSSREDLLEKIESMLAEKKELINEKKRITELWLAEYASSLGSDENSGCFEVKDLNKDHLKVLSEHYLEKYQLPCLFVSDEAGKTHFYIRFPQSLDINVQDFIQQEKSSYSLKGGGGKDFAVGQMDSKSENKYLREQFFHSFKDFIKERSDH
jgi:alanyl-tRNA synthetase